jgi:hypothetical protein
MNCLPALPSREPKDITDEEVAKAARDMRMMLRNRHL